MCINKIKINNPADTLRLALCFLFTLSIVACGGGSSQNQASTNEVWSGTAEDKSFGAIRAQLTVTPGKSQSDSGQYSLYYGVPRSCNLKAEETAAETNKVTLRLRDPSGGFCSDLAQADVIIDKQNKTTWLVTVQKSSIQFREIFTLTKEQ